MAAHPNILVLPLLAVPLALALLAHLGLMTSDALIRLRRYAFLGIVVIAAIFTPPDALSMVILALALVGLYEISIWCVRAAS